MTTLLDDLMDSMAVERIAALFSKAETPSELIGLWWKHADPYEDGSKARRFLLASYQKRLGQLTGARAG
jgi:hypothetical protein